MLSAKEVRYRNIVISSALVTGVISLALFFFLRWHETKVDDCSCTTIKQEQVGYQSHIDEARVVGDDLQLSGWLLKEGVEQKLIERHVVLKNHSSQEFLQLPTEIVRRPDLTDLRSDGTNYTYGGFYTTIALEAIDLTASDYTVFVLDASDGQEQLVEIAHSLREEIKNAENTTKPAE